VGTLIVPKLDPKPWPTLGPQIVHFIEDRFVFGPGPLKGQPAEVSLEKRGIIYRAYEIYPQRQRFAGRRRFKRVGWSVRKGLAKTELLAWIAGTELHPQAPVRFDHWAEPGEISWWGYEYEPGEPVGRPVASPYIPLLAYTKDQTEELAYGALKSIIEDCVDADLFDTGLERIARYDDRGREDGKAVPLAGSPNARDGARTTFQGFDEPHRQYTPRLKDAHNVMQANLPKRPDADAWSLYVGTAGELGQGSIQEDLHHEAQQIEQGKIKDARIFYFHRDAGKVHRGKDKGAEGHNLATKRGRIAAIKEATGPDGEYGPGQFEDIAEQWTRPKADLNYLERVWLNLWIQGDAQAFDPDLLKMTPGTIPLGALVTAGFDGARFKDSTAIVITDVATGKQQLYAMWERPLDLADDEGWEVPIGELDAVVDQLFFEYEVWRWNGDPPHYLESHATWAGKYPQVEEWWTHRMRAMAFAIRDYQDSLRDGSISFADDQTPAINSPVVGETMGEALIRHIGNAGRHNVNIYDSGEESDGSVEGGDPSRGRQLFILRKLHETRKFDACMAAILSWQGRIAALQKLDLTTTTSSAVKRLY
jgi:hypothetical protein